VIGEQYPKVRESAFQRRIGSNYYTLPAVISMNVKDNLYADLLCVRYNAVQSGNFDGIQFAI
jgi:hypothetical protein